MSPLSQLWDRNRSQMTQNTSCVVSRIQRTQHGFVPTAFVLNSPTRGKASQLRIRGLAGRAALPDGHRREDRKGRGARSSDSSYFAGRHHLPQPPQKWNLAPSLKIWRQGSQSIIRMAKLRLREVGGRWPKLLPCPALVSGWGIPLDGRRWAASRWVL